MSIDQTYQALASLLDYPRKKGELMACYRQVASHLEQAGHESPALPFARLVESSTLTELQEDYVAQIDFNPVFAPYLGHHLYGDNQKKAAFMIRVKHEFGRFGFVPTDNELPDHLGVMLSFLGHLARLGEDSFRRGFIEDLVLPGLKKLAAPCESAAASPWLTLVAAAELICSADCQEVTSC